MSRQIPLIQYVSRVDQNEITQLFEKLLEANVSFLVVGGFAVVAHGHSRLTHDLDLVLAMDSTNMKLAVSVFESFGLQPRIPVKMTEFLDPQKRAEWAEKRNMQVFSLLSASGRLVVDIFNQEPFDFADEFAKRCEFPWPGMDRRVPFVAKDTLVQMKRTAARPIDLDDVKHLENI